MGVMGEERVGPSTSAVFPGPVCPTTDTGSDLILPGRVGGQRERSWPEAPGVGSGPQPRREKHQGP